MSQYTVRNIQGVVYGDPVILERNAAANVKPGQILELNSSDNFALHSTAGGQTVPFIALMDFAQGEGVGDQIDSGEKVFGWVPKRGECGYVRIKLGENFDLGQHLESDGSGDFQASEGIGDSHGDLGLPVGVALEAIDLDDSAGAFDDNDYFCLVMFL